MLSSSAFTKEEEEAMAAAAAATGRTGERSKRTAMDKRARLTFGLVPHLASYSATAAEAATASTTLSDTKEESLHHLPCGSSILLLLLFLCVSSFFY